ncbi:MAG: hypothetical protein LBI65_01500, partial [Candidatus Symbiothrix sp.]|nr:hypothetical protein [Candidatus Symbiothrix sp.]
NPFNQNLNYEKILRFSATKIALFFLSPNIFQKKTLFLWLNYVNQYNGRTNHIKNLCKYFRNE